MNRIDFNQTGGFPLSTQILDAAQEAYKNFNQYGYLAGNDLVIITGCVPGAGGSVTNGFVSINGELLPFVGTTVTENVIIVETADSRGFEDGSVKPVIYERYATFGDGPDFYVWEEFRRPKTLFQLEDRLTLLEKAVPIGLVAIWGKPAEAIPEGWEIYVPIQGTTPVGRKTGDVNFGAVAGTKIGVAQVTLDITQIPAHEHLSGSESLYNYFGGGTFIGNRTYTSDSAQPSYKNQKTSQAGGGLSHTNIQPSIIVDFIQFVGF